MTSGFVSVDLKSQKLFIQALLITLKKKKLGSYYLTEKCELVIW